MAHELDDLLHHAAGAPDDGPDLAAIESRAARRTRTRLAAGGLAVMAAVGLGLAALPGPASRAPIVDTPEAPVLSSTVPLPAPGEVLVAHVGLDPVFVVRSDDGDVTVLDAVSPHRPEGTRTKVLAWCDAVPGFAMDLWSGSMHAPNGRWLGGPAPTSLPAWEVLAVGTSTVQVGARGDAPARDALPVPDGFEEAFDGQACGGDGSIGPLLLHEPLNPSLAYPTDPSDLPDIVLEPVPSEEDTAEPEQVDALAVPALADHGVAVDRADGVALLGLDGTTLLELPGWSLAQEPFAGQLAGPLLLERDGERVWLDPSSGETLAGDVVPLLGPFGVRLAGDTGTVVGFTDEPVVFDATRPWWVSNGHRSVTFSVCDGIQDGEPCPTRTFDMDMGGDRSDGPGCWATDQSADFNVVQVCDATFSATASLLRVFDAGTGEPYDVAVPTHEGAPGPIGTWRRAVLAGPGLVAEVSLECEVPRVVGVRDGEPVGLFGPRWEDGPTATLLGATQSTGEAVVLVPASSACGDVTPEPGPGLHVIDPEGAVRTLTTDVPGRVAMWHPFAGLAATAEALVRP